MLLGKRPRPHIKRTTSMTGITVDMSDVEAQEASDLDQTVDILHEKGDQKGQNMGAGSNGFDHYNNSSIMATVVSPRNYRRDSGDFSLETANFLRTCGLCKRRLSPGRDIYMYRGDTAFCSLECREQQMKQDERKEKCSHDAITKER